MILVNPNTRQFNIPGSDLVFGVEFDAGSEVKQFQCPRYVGNNVDLAGSFLRINWRNANGYVDSYLVEDVTIDGDNVLFSWELAPKVTEYKGQIRFVLCVIGADLKLKWHTTTGSGQVLEGLEPDHSTIADETADVVAQLIQMVNTQVAAVEAEGEEQIGAVQSAAEASQTAAVAQIEAKGTSTLASIPADYTALSEATNEQANAVKGMLVGAAVRADDVSPLEHVMNVKVTQKNLFNGQLLSGLLESKNFVLHDDGSGVYKSLRLAVPRGTYTISFSRPVNVVRKIHDGQYHFESNALNVLSYTITAESDGDIGLSFRDTTSSATVWDSTTTIQIEKGDTASEYTPYVDPTTVKVRRCGKNIIPYPYPTTSQVYNGISYTANDDGSIVIDGTAEGSGISFMLVPISAGQRGFLPSGTYYLSCPEIADNAVTLSLYTYDENDSDAFTQSFGKNRIVTLDEGKYYGLYLRVGGGVTVSNLTVRPQLELGNIVGVYNPPGVEDYTPAADGTVGGVTSLSPTLTLLTDTPGVTVECEYNRDTNKVIADILSKIAALGGI